MQQQVLSFWFKELEPGDWFNGSAAVDAQINRRFSSLLVQAAAGELQDWRQSAHGRLAEIIVLDQFSRNTYRGTAQAFASDPVALVLSQEAVCGGALAQLDNAAQRSFLLMPYMHSESKFVHERAVRLLRDHTTATEYGYELQHKAIIDRFGRYPHRNALLGRVSTAEELEFLRLPGSSF